MDNDEFVIDKLKVRLPSTAKELLACFEANKKAEEDFSKLLKGEHVPLPEGTYEALKAWFTDKEGG